MNITDDLKKKDDKKVWESYLGTLNKDKLVLEPIPEHLDVHNTNLFDQKEDKNMSNKKKEVLLNDKQDVFRKDKLNKDNKDEIKLN